MEKCGFEALRASDVKLIQKYSIDCIITQQWSLFRELLYSQCYLLSQNMYCSVKIVLGLKIGFPNKSDNVLYQDKYFQMRLMSVDCENETC